MHRRTTIARVDYLPLSLTLFLLILSLACGEKKKEPILLEGCQQYEFEIVDLPFEKLFNIDGKITAVDNSKFVADPDSIFLFKFNGVQSYHPVSMAHTCFSLFGKFVQSGDSAYVRQIRKYAARFEKNGYSYDSAVYFPYLFDYTVHKSEKWPLTAPWFSGMAQGEILGVFSRLFEVTGDSTYLAFAHRIFNSFLRVRSEGTPWIARYDENGCYWIEEYPLERPGMTLNGFMYAIFGVYDYYCISKSEAARDILVKSLSTIKSYIHLYRRPGADSYYCLEHQHLHPNNSYHLIHIAQLRGLYAITGDSFFNDIADSLYDDSHEPAT